MRIATSLEKSCSRRWKCFNAPFLRIGCTQWAFEEDLPCKKRNSLQNWFLRDLLQFLEKGDAAERLYACDTLLSWRGCGLGRFQPKILVALFGIAIVEPLFGRLGELPWETRAKALQASIQFLPKDAAEQCLDLYCELPHCRRLMEALRAPSTFLSDLDTLIETLAPTFQSTVHIESETACQLLSESPKAESDSKNYSCGCFTM